MRTLRILSLAALIPLLLAGCESPTPPPADQASARPAPDHAPSAGSALAVRISGTFAAPHSWSILERIRIIDLEAWRDRDGTVGGSHDLELLITLPGRPPFTVRSVEEVVCLDVDPSTRTVWFTTVRPQGDGLHYAIVQARDLAPAAMDARAREASGRADMVAGRSALPGEEDCTTRPDLASVPHRLGVVEMQPIEPGGDFHLQLGLR